MHRPTPCGKHAGDTADVTLPGGAVIQYKVLEIRKSTM